MKTILFLTFLFATATVADTLPDHTAWQWFQPVKISVPGMTRLELAPATLGASQASLGDLRLVAPDGVETPYLFEDTTPPRVEDQSTTDFRATLDGRRTVLTAIQNAGEIDAITLQSPARGFLKSATVEGRDDGGTWQPIVSGEVVFRQDRSTSRLRIPLPHGSWPQLRVTLDDDRSPPVAFTGLRVTPAATRATTDEFNAIITSRAEGPGETRVTLGLGAKNLNLSELLLDVPEGVFSRACKISIELQGRDGPPTQRVIGSGTIYRVLSENGDSVASLSIPLNQRVAADNLIVTIANHDSPPLDLRGASITRFPDRLLFFASQAGPWKLLIGNRHAATPRYDLAPLRAEMTRTPGSYVSPGPMVARPDYQPPAALPKVAPAGSDIDLAKWGRRRTIQASAPGVITIELDPVALAHAARSDLGDLRLIQNGKQIPWLLEAKPPTRTFQPEVELIPDPKRPKNSRWKITLPVSGLPVYNLEAQSPDPLFTREIRVTQQSKDELGNPYTRLLGSTTWTKGSVDGIDRKTHTIQLKNARVPNELWLETDNGDNPPIRLENFAIGFHAPSLVAKITDTAPVFLYYDNPHASPPAYDLSLIRSELLAADKQTATLGKEEILDAATRRSDRDISSGSPWLWAALAVVVILLLFIVAKMLPQEADHQAS